MTTAEDVERLKVQVRDLERILVREGAVEASYERQLAEAVRERDEARAARDHFKEQLRERAEALLDARAEVERLSKLENSLPASLRDAHVVVEELRARLRTVAERQRGVTVERWGATERERDEARAERDNLPAIIHRDGGHYIGQHGVTKAVADAHATWAAVVRERDEARAEAKERSEFAAAETAHANRWAERAHAAEKRCKEIGDEAELAQHERDEARAEVERLRKAKHTNGCRQQSAYNAECVCGADEAQRDLLRTVAERQREAVARHAEDETWESLWELYAILRATPLVTEGEP